jgi:uncharacterized membrane protein YkoI
MNKGKVIDIQNKYIVVMNDQMTYEKIEKKNGLSLGKEIYYFEEDLYKERKQPVKKYFLVAAVLFMMLFIQPLLVAEEAYGYISVDINPSIELQVNKGLDVLSIEAINEDAKTYIKEEWIGKPAKEVIDLIIEETKRKGVLNTERNFVLVSYYFNDEDPTSEEVFVQSLDELFNEKIHDYEVAVIKSDAETYTDAKEANESLGKHVVNKKMNEKVEDIIAVRASIEEDEDFKIYKEKDDEREDDSLDEKALEDNPGRKNEKNPIFGDREDVPGLNKQKDDIGNDQDIDEDEDTDEDEDEDEDREDDDKDQDFRQTRKMITPPEAKAIALDLVKGRIIKVKLDRDNSEAEYEIDIIKAEEIHELIIDGFTGEIISHEVDKTEDEDNKGNSKGSNRDDESDNDLDDEKEKNKPNNNGKSAISRKAAEAIAIELLGGKGEVLAFDFDRDDSTAEYTIEIQLNGKIHEMKIDGFTGEVLDHDIEVMEIEEIVEADEEEENNDKGNENDELFNEGEASREHQNQKHDEKSNDIIEREKAENIAFERIGGEGKIEAFDLEIDDDIKKYIFEINLDGIDYLLEIHAITGEVIEYEYDKKSEDSSNEISEENDSQVLLKEAIEVIALDYVQGEIENIEIEEDDDQVIYMVSILKDNLRYSLEINGYTGEIIDEDSSIIEVNDDDTEKLEDEDEAIDEED